MDREKVDRNLEKEYKGNTIELKEVNIHYKDGENVIHRGDFIANAGEITAVVGPSGEGKTTLIRGLLRLLYPMEGRAELKNGEGIKCRLSAGTREFFSYVPQGNTIFAGSIAENMRRVKEDATDEENLDEALASGRQVKDLFWQAWTRLRLSEMWQERGEPDKALAVVTDAFETAVQVQNPRFESAVFYTWGNILLSKTNWADAEQKFQQAYNLKQQAGQIEQTTPALAGMAYAAYQQGKHGDAAAHAEQLWQTWQESPIWAERASLKLYWMLGLVWQGLKDSRTDVLWEKALDLLETRSKKISSEEAQKKFLEQVPAHRAILRQGIESPISGKSLRPEN